MDQNNQSFNLADVADVLKKRRKFIALFVFTAGLTAVVLVFFVMPKYYKSTSVIVAANPALADQAKLFNENIEGLYSAFGGEDDLNRLLGIASLDTTYKLLVNEFDLINYYNIKGRDSSLNLQKAVLELKEDIELNKNELYQFKISASTKNKHLSASLVNRMVEIIHGKVQESWNQSFLQTLEKLATASKELENQYNLIKDSSQQEIAVIKKQGILQQLQQNEKIINRTKVSLTNNPPALIVLEKAYPAPKADRPKKLLIILGALIAAFIFSSLAVLAFERPK